MGPKEQIIAYVNEQIAMREFILCMLNMGVKSRHIACYRL